MKIRVFGNEVAEEPVFRFRLQQFNDRSISLCVVDENGEELHCGNLLHINVDSSNEVTFTRAMAVNDRLGLTLDDDQIIIK